ncbi:hypothetical protein [Pseudomonas typographi]|uniref:Uncharacterized protein n=1 Tax=Pseudomonas typographi TaxID=2715964 RepID=A0ABR7Z6M3_9PSED|nr:hypothetical protein [Pseudomonas typographi]MBD1554489.1 hypothetical protein [Pseudomonas typographi]MBD1590135.1 hypothetical protein [Pseudomonas typographi]MBD1601092.1 hypothetical protein [Pseudomonas typographi]
MALIQQLELALPNHRIDCVLCQGWSATVLIATQSADEWFCTPGVALEPLSDQRDVSHLAQSLKYEMEMARFTKACP